jgi:hypothetical protein
MGFEPCTSRVDHVLNKSNNQRVSPSVWYTRQPKLHLNDISKLGRGGSVDQVQALFFMQGAFIVCCTTVVACISRQVR